MNRVSLKCACCGNQDLEVTVNECVPNAIYLTCNKKGCGRMTPLAFFDEKGRAYAVNGTATTNAYNETYCKDVTPKEAMDAVYADYQEVFDTIYDELDTVLGGTFSKEIMENYFLEFPFNKHTATEAMIELADRAKILVLRGEILLSELIGQKEVKPIEEETRVARRGGR